MSSVKKYWKSHVLNRIRRPNKDRGAALIVTLMVMLILVLLALALVQQSQTEYLIARNEEDALAALSFAEAGLDWADRRVINFVRQPVPPADLDLLLAGPTAGGSDDNLFGFGDLSLTDVNDFTSANEATASAIVSRDFGFGDGSRTYEVVRMGTGSTRALVYVRMEDNYDSAMDVNDTDFRMRVKAVAEYPIFVKSDGSPQDVGSANRGLAVRRLIGRYEPAGNVAIRTDGDLEMHGSLQVCGECGGVHANQGLDINQSAGDNLAVCAEATATGSIEVDTGSGSGVRGGAGLAGEVYIPVINPFDDRYVPIPADFDTQTAPEAGLPAYLQCPALNPVTDPGASKYFALVVKTVNGDNQMQVYKAYWDTTFNHWVWRLIDDKITNADTLNAVLDNCGRLVSATINESTAPVVLSSDPGVVAGSGVNDGGGGQFYGFSVSNGSRYATSCTTPGDNSLSTTEYNDYTFNAFPKVNEPAIWPQLTAVTTSPDADANTPALPGTARTRNNMVFPYPTTDSPATADYVSTAAISRNKAEWEITANTVYSPLYGAVIFVYGNLKLAGGLGTLAYNNAGAQATVSPMPNDRWRASFIVFNSIDVGGNPSYAPAFPDNDDYAFQMVAGRDIVLAGTAGSRAGSQDQCPSMAVGSDCTASPGEPPGFAGIYLAHEQVQFQGNVTMDGFIIAEDAARCTQDQVGDSQAYGSVQIHYDCENPPDPWARSSTRLVSWEEVR